MSSNYNFDVLSPCIGFFCTPLVHCVWMWWYVNWQLCTFQVAWTMPIDQIPPSINMDITPSHMKSLDIPALPPCLLLVLPTFRGTRLENMCLKKCRFQCASGSLCKLMESKVLGDDFGRRFFMCDNYEYDPPKCYGKDKPKVSPRTI